MAKFSKKASGGTGGSKVDWEGFNEHLAEQIGKNKLRPAVLSGIVDVGKQEREDSEFDYKNEERQNKLLEEGKATLSEDGTKIIRPRAPADSVVLIADFPSIQINYGKFFSKDGADDFKPYRHLITGEFKGLAGTAALTCVNKDGKWVYDAKHTISKLANAMELVDGDVPQDFDIGELLGKFFMMQLGTTKKGEAIYVKAKDIVPMMDGMSTPEYTLEPFGVMFSGDNDEADLRQIKSSVRKRMELSPDWEESGVKKELDELYKSSDNKPASSNTKAKTEDKTEQASGPQAIEEEEVEEEGSTEGKLPF